LEVMVYQLPDGSAFLLGVPEIERIAAEIAAR
jgi:hypothetical protein